MWRTVKYCIWPRDIRFEEGIAALVEFAGMRKLNLAAGKVIFDNTFRISVTDIESVSCDSLDEFVDVMKRMPVFENFTCTPFFSDNNKEHFLRTGISFDHRRVTIDVASSDLDLVDGAHQFFKEQFRLKNPEFPSSPDDRPKYLHPTIFIGRHFDEVGNRYYELISSFLELLGFDVKQGVEYTSQSIPEKVKARIALQDVFLGVVSGDREQSWLIAEPSYALGKGKHVVLAIENEAQYNPTILGHDLEQIRFSRGHIEQTFIPLLREFRSIRIRGI